RRRGARGAGRGGGGGGGADRCVPARRAVRRGAAGDRGSRGDRERRAVAEGHGRRDAPRDGGRRRARRRQAGIRARARLARGMRTKLELTNEVAAELAGSQDAVLRALEQHLDCKVFLRGNLITFDGAEDETSVGERVVRELADLIERGHEIGPGTIAAVTGALDAHESPARVLEDVVWSHRGLRVAPKSVNQKRYVDAIRKSTITFG